MNKKLINRILMILIIVLIIGGTILASYLGSILFTSQDFKGEVLFEFIGSVALVITLVGLSLKIYIDMIGGKK